MKIKIKRDDIGMMDQALKLIRMDTEIKTVNGKDSIIARQWPLFFEYFLKRNLEFLEKEVKILGEMEKTKLEAYHKERLALNDLHAEKDGVDKPIQENGKYKIAKANQEKYDADMKELKEKYKKELDDWQKFQDEEIEIEVFGLAFPRVADMRLPNGALDFIDKLFTDKE